MKRAFVLPITLLLVLLFVVPVTAAPPVISTGTFDDDYPAFEPSPCGFAVRNHEVGIYQSFAFYDNQGNLERLRFHFKGSDHFYNPANPAKVLSGTFSGVTEVDLNTGEFVLSSGLTIHITEPGCGTVMQRVGRWTRYPDAQLGGKNSLLVPSDVEQFCALLATD